MKYLSFQNEYDRYPTNRTEGCEGEAWSGWDRIRGELARSFCGRKILTVECYPGVEEEALLARLSRVADFGLVIRSAEIFPGPKELTDRMRPWLTDDRVRGIYCYGEVGDFVVPERLEAARERIRGSEKPVLVLGFAASLITRGDLLVYADLTRWEIQLRYRRGMPNYRADNGDEDFLRKYKRGYFIEWRIADRLKEALFSGMDYYLDSNETEHPAMATGHALRKGLHGLVNRPFRLVPYFDPGVWGGQWMKEVCGLEPDAPNYAWSFDGVPEENSLRFRMGETVLQVPAMNLTLMFPREFLGEKTYARFGAEYPIRFDFLDTMDGQNLSLQVHPTAEYIHRKFGMAYTQDESYFILDAGEDGGVYLGLKEGIIPEEMIRDLELAQASADHPFPSEKYVNRFPAKKFDHFLIPAGTVHCSSRNCMVLEVSATPYIFTFKLWDWDRLGLDGKPRPIHIEDGKRVIRFDRTTGWVRENLINRFSPIVDTPEYTEIKTGLHELEFIETRLLHVRKRATMETGGEFMMCNLVDGRGAVVESPENAFQPFEIHYAETFILPAGVARASVRPMGCDEIRILRASVRF